MPPSLSLSPPVAHDLTERLGLRPSGDPADLARLITAMARALPVGTVAKHEAVARGTLPPGADADECARLVLADLNGTDTPAGSSTRGARPRPTASSWTCWVLTTLCAALVESAWGWPARIVATRNLDGRVPVDFHSMVEVDGPHGVLVLDPLFAVGPIPVGGRVDGPWGGSVHVEDDGRRVYRWSQPSGTEARYRSLTESLDADDVTAFLHVSLTHTGMSSRRWWRIAGETTCASLTDDDECGPLLKRYRWGDGGWERDEAFMPSWTGATAAAIDHVWGPEPR